MDAAGVADDPPAAAQVDAERRAEELLLEMGGGGRVGYGRRAPPRGFEGLDGFKMVADSGGGGGLMDVNTSELERVAA